MAVERLGDKLGIKEDVIRKACALAFKAHKSGEKEKHYVVDKIRSSSETTLLISFPASWSAHDWYSGNSFGETKLNLEQFRNFRSLRSIGNDEAASVNEPFLSRFDSFLSNSPLKSEVERAMTERKRIVFAGHSSGAPIAILATLWTLEEYLNPKKNQTQNYIAPFCVTFGSPLVGNHIFSHATRRENWSCYFIHFVMRYDIVPRILLAPFSSVERMFKKILQFLTPRSKSSTPDIIGGAPETSDFYLAVMRNAATVASHAACNLMGSTNLLLETVTNFIELSPYRPFGTYIFCTGNGKLVVLRNPDAILQLLFHSAQLSDLAEGAEVAKKSILEHLVYESELQDSLEMQNVVYLDKLDELPLSADGSNSDIATALSDLGLSTRARLCLRAAGELEKQKLKNQEKIDIEKALTSMKELEDYKQTCLIQGGNYYDAFKQQKEARDFQANVKRLVLAGVWDEIIEMLKRYELPEEFEGKPQWIEYGTNFRRLVEPLDIANYYRHLKHEDTGPYMVRARPKRYRYTQRWLEHAKRMDKEEITESSFWAKVEELSSTTSNKPFRDIKDEVVKLEQKIKNWIEKDKVLQPKDVFSKGSTFVEWWSSKKLPDEHKAASCIASLINM